MCDYSLESYKSRAAVDGEDLIVKQFPSGSKGFVEARHDRAESLFDCAVCCQDGVEMTLHLRGTFQTRSIKAKELDDAQDEEFDGEIPVVFHTLPRVLPVLPWPHGAASFGYRDGFILPNGRYLSIQRLAPGTRATVTKALPKELSEAVKTTKAFEPEIRVEEPTAPAPIEA